MSVLNKIVKNAVNSKQSLSFEDAKKLQIMVGDSSRVVYLEDIIELTKPRDLMVAVEVWKREETNTPENFTKMKVRVDHILDTIRKSVKLPEKLTVVWMLRMMRPGSSEFDYTPIDTCEERVDIEKMGEKYLFSDMVIMVHKSGRVTINRAKGFLQGCDHTAWGKINTSKLITRLINHGLTSPDKISAFADKINISETYFQHLMLGYHSDISEDVYSQIAEELSTTPEELGYIAKT